MFCCSEIYTSPLYCLASCIIIICCIFILFIYSLVKSYLYKIPKKVNHLCSICLVKLRTKDKCIECNMCCNWIHFKCSLLSLDEFNEHVNCKENPWSCSKCTASFFPFNTVDDNDLFLENLRLCGIVSSDLNIIPSNELNVFLTESNDLSNTFNETQPEKFPHVINSQYYDNHRFNQIKPDLSSTLGILHTKLASINKYHDDLSTVLTLLKPEIHIIGISEHKIHKNYTNLEGYHPFVFDPTETTHGETGFYIKDSLVFKRKDDLKFNSSSDHESTFIEIILPNKKNLILGCIYRQPNSKVPVNCFIDNYI